ncbi:MAG: caspase family protein [Bacteriovoracaceae bacterium]|nr:caspase family protein [Bacteroidota bacterium]
MVRSLFFSLFFLATITVSAQTIYLQPSATNSTRKTTYISAKITYAGDLLSVIAADRTVKLVEAAALNERGTISIGASKAIGTAFSRDGKTLIVGLQDGNIAVCDAARATGIRSFSHGSSIRAIDIEPSGRVVSGGYDRVIKMWDYVTGMQVGKFPAVSAEIISLTLSPDGRIVVAGSADGSITMFNTMSYTVFKTITSTRSAAHAIVFNPDGKYFAAAHGDSTVTIWNGRNGDPVSAIRSSTGAVSSIAFHPIKPYLISASSVISFWDVVSSKMFYTYSEETFSPQHVAVAQNNILAAVSRTGEFRTFQILEKKPDQNAPVISIITPQSSGNESIKMFSNETEITGIVSDESAVKGVTVNGIAAVTAPATQEERGSIAAALTAVSFSISVPLSVTGQNSISIAAVDAENNSANKELSITKLSKDAALEFVNPTESIETDQISTDLQFKIWFDFATYTVQLNTVEIVKKENLPRKPSGTLRTEKLSLSAGLNQIQLSVNGKNGERIRKSINITRRTLGAPASLSEDKPLRNTSGQPQRWAVIVGVSEYGNPAIKNLAYADRDAKAFAEFLKSSAGGGYEEERVKILTNKEATLQNIKSALFNFLRQTVETDLVVIYFAGHGAPEPANPNNNYLLCYDTDPNSLETTAFPMWDVNTALQRYIPSKRVVVFTDACHSGGISSDIATRGMSSTDNNLINQYLSDLSKTKEGIIVFTASQAGEVSQELDKFGHGVFTYYILEGMKGQADFNNDYTVTIGELMDFVEEKVKRQTNGNQHPTRNQGTYDKDLTISLVPN